MNNPTSRPQIKITPDMMKSFKTLTCDCGGMIFHTGVVVKKISALISPTGEEESYPLEVLICDKCGKIPSELNASGMLPNEVIAKKVYFDGGGYVEEK
jgi:hypothetical protein